MSVYHPIESDILERNMARWSPDYLPALASILHRHAALARADRDGDRPWRSCLIGPDLLASSYSSVRDIASETGNITTSSGTAYGYSISMLIQNTLTDWIESRPAVNLAVVGCGSSKVDTAEPVEARDLYDSSYWSCKEKWASTADDWKIISAKHGLLDPQEQLLPYDRTVEDLRGVPVDSDGTLPTGSDVDDRLDEWALRVGDSLRGWVRRALGPEVAHRDVRLQVCLGKRYEAPLRGRGVFAVEDLGRSTVTVEWPWRESDLGGIGDQMEWLSDRAEVNK